MTDLEKAGLLGDSQDALPDEMMDEEFLDSPVGRIMQALAGLEMAISAFDSRIGQCETYLTYLLSKDPTVGKKIHEMSKATLAAEQAQQGEALNEGQDK